MPQQRPAHERTDAPGTSEWCVQVRGRPLTFAASHSRGEDGDLVLILHDLGGTRTAFNPLHARTRTGGPRRWLAIDWPGHGQSPPIESGGDTLGLYADLAIALVAHLAPRRVHLVGHGMGAAVALIAAPALPLGALIAVEPALTGPEPHDLARQITGYDRAVFIRTGFTRLRDHLLAASKPETALRGTWLVPADPATIWDAAASLTAWCESGGLITRWPHHRATLLHGEHSHAGARLRRALPLARTDTIPRTGPLPMIDNPVGLAARITAAADRAETAHGAP